MDILYVVMPVYNEEANIEETIRTWYPVIERHNGNGLSRLVIVNDGSKDTTLQRSRAMAAERPLMEILDKPNSGHGPTVIMAYRYALEHGADYIFQTDSDGQTDPAEFEGFWNDRERYDGIFGVRVKRGDGEIRAWVERVICLMLKLYFGTNIRDANAPFRLWFPCADDCGAGLSYLSETQAVFKHFLSALHGANDGIYGGFGNGV